MSKRKQQEPAAEPDPLLARCYVCGKSAPPVDGFFLNPMGADELRFGCSDKCVKAYERRCGGKLVALKVTR